ncbi:MAG: acyl-CoA thioesterase [Methanobacteriota archaeon]|jgi:acyl-CoA hydrolase|nr:MAG: acyl-CoA thioesterase [Euryarchaeota archaeon]
MDEPYSTEPVVLLNEVFPQDTNSRGTLFGGRLLSIMDTAAGIVSSKFAHKQFVTISIDSLKFMRPAWKGDLVEVTSRVVFTSRTTTGVYVVARRLTRSDWEPEDICAGFFFMVAVDSDMRPTPVPQHVPSTPEEEELWAAAQAARDEMIRSD